MPASNFDNPLAGLMSFLGGVNAPQQQQQAPPAPTRTIPLKAPSREMKMPSASGLGIGDILNKINKEEKKIVNTAPLPPTQAASFANGSGNTAPMTFASGPPPPQPARKSVLKRSGGSERKSAKNSVVIKL
jgi:hypothetical protein